MYILARLPYFLGCPEEHSIDEAKLAFKRVCFRDVIIIAVEAVRANYKPVCIWRVYYEMKNAEYDYEDDDNSSNIPPSELTRDEVSLKQLFEDLTANSVLVGMEVARKYYTDNRLTAIVEYFPKECECQLENFSMATEEPRMWPITEAEINFSRLNIHM